MTDLRMKAACNPFLAVRVGGGSRVPYPGYPERLHWTGNKVGACKTGLFRAIILLQPKYRAVILARFGEEVTLQAYGTRIERSRERVRQLEAKAVRIMRGHMAHLMTDLREATVVVPIPGGALDPDWLYTKQASELTGLTTPHIRYLCRTGRVKARKNPLRRNAWQLSRTSLQAYVLDGQGDRRKTGEWRPNR